MDEHTGEADALLIAAGERGGPIGFLVETIGEMRKAGRGHRRANFGIVDRGGERRVGQRLPQRAERKVRPLRQSQHARARG